MRSLRRTLRKTPKVLSKEDLYSALAEFHHYTPDEIAEMNIFQQLAVLKVSSSPQQEEISFERVEDYLRWKQQEGFK